MRTLTANDSFEVEVGLSGKFSPGYPEQAPSYACGGEPEEPADLEDVEITSLGLVVWDNGTRSHRTINLLDGVDIKCPDIQKLFENLLALRCDDVCEALFSEAFE